MDNEMTKLADFEALKERHKYLENMVELMLIKAAGITELEGDYIEVYNQAERVVQRRTAWVIDQRVRQMEANRIQNKIDELKRELEGYTEDGYKVESYKTSGQGIVWQNSSGQNFGIPLGNREESGSQKESG